MIEFITKYFNFIVYAFELITAITAVLLFKKFKNTATKYFIYFLFFVVFVECMGTSLIYFRETTIIKFFRSYGIRSNNWYNLFWMFGSILVVLKYYYELLNNSVNKRLIIIVSILFTLSFIGHTVLYFDSFLTTHPPFYSYLNIIVIFICVGLFFLELLNSDLVLNMFKVFGFYASIGLFIWWLIIGSVLLFDIYNTKADLDFVNLKRRVFLFANIFMYSCFTVGLILSNPIVKND